MGKYSGMRSRNHGYGRNLAYAGTQILWERFGGGHFSSVASHGERWRSFASWAREAAGIRDMRDITKATIMAYASALNSRGLAISTIHNRLSTVNVIMSHAREGHWERISPRALSGATRTTVRTVSPASLNRARYQDARVALAAAGLDRASAVLALAREFGMRSEEAVKADLDRLVREAITYGSINIIDGTKGGRTAPRWVPISPDGQQALAAARAARPDGSRNLLRPGETYKSWRANELRAGRAILHDHGIRGYHDARAAYACARYAELTGHPAPAVAGGRRRADRNVDRAARATLAAELGHGRTGVVVAYVGSAR